VKPEPRCERCGGETYLLTQPCPKCQKRDQAEASIEFDRECGYDAMADIRLGVLRLRDEGRSEEDVRRIVDGELWAYRQTRKAA
jgi:DnaJ-class molecular chaperone